MRARRLLVVGTVLGQPMGGVRRHNAELLPRLHALLASEGGGLAVLEGREPVAFDLPADVERIAGDVPSGPPSLRAISEGRAVRAALAEAAAAGRPFDAVHTGHLPVPLSLPAPLTLTLHDLRNVEPERGSAPRRMVARKLIGLALRSAARVFTVSQHVGARLRDEFGLDAARHAWVPNAADHFEPLPRDAGEGSRLLCVGHLEPRKNLELVLRALAEDPGLPDLELAGAAKGDEEARLRDVADALGVAARVHFRGPFDDADLPRLYARAAAVVFPSRIEGFGIPALEAQRAGCPLAIASTPALVEVAGRETPRFEADDPADCARAIREALASTKCALARVRQYASERTWDDAAVRWRESFASLGEVRGG